MVSAPPARPVGQLPSEIPGLLTLELALSLGVRLPAPDSVHAGPRTAQSSVMLLPRPHRSLSHTHNIPSPHAMLRISEG